MSLDTLRKSPPIPSLKAIQAFEQVARFGNVARAAEQLNLTPRRSVTRLQIWKP